MAEAKDDRKVAEKSTEKKNTADNAKKTAEKKPAEKIAKGAKETKEESGVAADPFAILKYVLMTERAIQFVESQNKLVFIVRRSATKQEIMSAAKAAFKSDISQVQTLIDQKGRKKAFIKFSKEGEAGEIAIRLGII